MNRIRGRLERLERLNGFDGYDPAEIERMADELLDAAVKWVDETRRRGLDPRAVLDAGGPMPEGVDRDAALAWLDATEG